MTSLRPEIILSAKDQTKAAFASASRALDGLKGDAVAAKAGLVGLGAAAASALAFFQARGSIDMLDRLDDLSEKTGIAVEKLSELRFAGEATGTPLEALATGVGRLSKQMAEAAGGNKEAIETFKSLGVEVKNADGSLRSSDAVLGDLADRFKSYEDGAAKAALAQRIFGKSGAEMIPLLNQGRDGIERLRVEAEQLGAIYGGSLAKDAATLNDNLTKLRLASEAAAIAMAGPFITSLVRITDQMIAAKKEAGLLNAALVAIGGGVARTLGLDEVGAAQRRANDATSEMKRIQGMMIGVELQVQRDPTNEVAQRRLSTYRSKLEQLQKTAAAASEELKELANKLDPAGDPQKRVEDRNFVPDLSGNKRQAPTPGGGGGSSKKAKDDEAETKRYLESLEKQVEKVKELSQVEQALAEIQRIRLGGGKVTEEQKQQILQKAAEIDATKALSEAEKDREKEREEAQRRMFALQDEGRRIYEDTRTPLEAYNAELDRLGGLLRSGAIDADTHTRAIAKAASAYSEAEKKARETGDDLDSFGKKAAENIQDELGRGLASALEGDFDNIGKSFSKLLIRMASEAAAAQISRALFGDLVKGGSGTGLLGGLFTGNFGFGGGGYSAADQAGLDSLIAGLPKYDVGTDYVPQDMLAVVHKGEKIIPAAENKGNGQRPLVVQQYYTVGDVASVSMVRKATADSERRIAAAFSRSRSYGGAAE